jgi:hypothetical protein
MVVKNRWRNAREKSHLGCKELLSLILEKRQLLCLVLEVANADS